MALNGYNYHENCFKKVHLNNTFYKQKYIVPRDMSHKQSKSREKTLTTSIPEMKRKVLERIKRVSMGLSVWRETSKKLTVCREKGKKLTVCRELFLFR